MKLVAALGRNRDVFVGPDVTIASGAAGSAADAALETVIGTLPDLSLCFSPSAASGSSAIRGSLARNEVQNRQIVIVPQSAGATSTGATNSFDWRVHLYRGGVLQGALAFMTLTVSTTVATAVTVPGVQAVTPAAMTGIRAGQQLLIDTGATAREQVIVLSTTATTFTANFTKTHTASFAVATSLIQWLPSAFTPAWGGVLAGATLPAITAGANVVVTPNAVGGLSGVYGIHVGDKLLINDATPALVETVTVSAVTTTTFTATFANSHSASTGFNTASLGLSTISGALAVIQPSDVLTLARVSTNVTGLASPSALLISDWSLAASPMGE